MSEAEGRDRDRERVLMTRQKTVAKTLISPLVEDFNKNIMKANEFMETHKHTAYE